MEIEKNRFGLDENINGNDPIKPGGRECVLIQDFLADSSGDYKRVYEIVDCDVPPEEIPLEFS